MRNLLRRIAFISMGLLALLIVQPSTITRALADDEPGYDYGGYDDSWEYCDCSCDNEEPHCYTVASIRACVVDESSCPAPATTFAPATCYSFPDGLSAAFGINMPPPPPETINDLTAFRDAYLPAGYTMYVRLMNCPNGTAVASIHFVPPTYEGVGSKILQLIECAEQGKTGEIMWLKPIDPPCGGDIYLYR